MTRAAAEHAAALLERQHRRIQALLTDVRLGRDRAAAFAELVRLIVAHESVEQSLVYPIAHPPTDAARRSEQHQLLRALAELYDLGVQHPEFDRKFAQFTDLMSTHLTHQNLRELPLVRNCASPAYASRITAAVELVETFACVHRPVEPEPHRAVPPLSLFSRLCAAVDAGLGNRKSQAELDTRPTPSSRSALRS
ncbi:hemerythrin domain-containing protein [Nocardia sp. NPDC051321]|uniref:hemerythrin domain-containing protein n=1 Tax=Nocardia sp. NPDC051321 TaxID=3364323 RepID=UPI0037A1205E